MDSAKTKKSVQIIPPYTFLYGKPIQFNKTAGSSIYVHCADKQCLRLMLVADKQSPSAFMTVQLQTTSARVISPSCPARLMLVADKQSPSAFLTTASTALL
jgi:hypothetical protein